MGGRDLSRVSFLVADDNEFSRKLVRTILKALHVRDLRRRTAPRRSTFSAASPSTWCCATTT